MTVRWYSMSGQPVGFETVGYLAGWLSTNNPLGAAEQIDQAYAHGGGWQAFDGFTLEPDNTLFSLTYPGDPPFFPKAIAHLRNEVILFYPYSWVGVVQPDGSFEVARID